MAGCVSPFRSTTQKMDLPCGKCHECKARRSSGWAFRLYQELKRAKTAYFVTLTYDNLFLPLLENGMPSLVKKDLQNYLKRLRKANKREKLKYYACGEYGGKTKRPHYHMILFNADPFTIETEWRDQDTILGNVKLGDVNPASIAYVCKYMNKKSDVGSEDPRQPEFALMSKKLGDNYLTKNARKWHKADAPGRVYCNLLDGKKVAMPRYYRDKVYNSHEKKRIAAQARLREFEIDVEKERKDLEKNNLIAFNKATKHDKENRNTRSGL